MVGFVKVVKCSFDKNTWYYNQVGQVFFIYQISQGEWLIPYTPLFKLDLSGEIPSPDEALVLLIHKSDVIPWHG